MSFGYSLNLLKGIRLMIPLVIYMMVTVAICGDYRASIPYYEGDTKLCYFVNNNILEQYKQAEYSGINEFDLHLPPGLGSYSFTADRISNTLYRHAIVKKWLKANIVLEPIEFFMPE